MKTPSRIVTQKWQLTSMAYAGIVIFLGTLLSGILATIAFSASGCLLTKVIRCFSISRDAIGVTLFGLKMWSLPALVISVCVVVIGRVRGRVVWWYVLIAAPATYLVLAIVTGEAIGRFDIPELLVQSVILFVFVQLALNVSRLVRTLPI